jgi:H2-forming N5,N10-methylenetetrahydromethanopterin dehydrogenase-like enzyme
MSKLKAGEKYLTIRMAGHSDVKAFPNKDRSDNQPHFKGDGVAVWVNEKKAAETTEETVI